MNNKKLSEFRTYNPNDCTQVGYKLTLYGDGRVAAEKRSRWRDSRDGVRYVIEDQIEPTFENEDDAEAALRTFWRNEAEAFVYMDDDFHPPTGWRVTNRGYIVK